MKYSTVVCFVPFLAPEKEVIRIYISIQHHCRQQLGVICMECCNQSLSCYFSVLPGTVKNSRGAPQGAQEPEFGTKGKAISPVPLQSRVHFPACHILKRKTEKTTICSSYIQETRGKLISLISVSLGASFSLFPPVLLQKTLILNSILSRQLVLDYWHNG